MNRLKELRTRANKTQKQLSDILGVSEMTISRWEKEPKLSIKHEYTVKLAEKLGVTIPELLSYDTPTFETTKDETIELLNKYSNILEAERINLSDLTEVEEKFSKTTGKQIALNMISEAKLKGIEQDIFAEHTSSLFSTLSDIERTKKYYFAINSSGIEAIEHFYQAIGNLPFTYSELLIHFAALSPEQKQAILETVKKLSLTDKK